MSIKKVFFCIFIFLSYSLGLMAKGGGSSGPTLQKYEYEFQDESNNTINDFNKSFETVDLVIKGIYDDNTVSEKGRYRLSPTKGKIWINSAEIFYMENLDISVKQEVGSVVINNKEVSASTVYRVNNKDRIEIDLNPDQSLSFTFLQDSEAPTIEYTGVESKILKNGNKLSFRISDNYSNISLLCSDENVDIEEFINNQKNLPTRNSIDDKSVELVLGNNRRINDLSIKYIDFINPQKKTYDFLPLMCYITADAIFETVYELNDTTDYRCEYSFRISDKVGNTTEYEDYFILDNTAPEVIISPFSSIATTMSINANIIDANGVKSIVEYEYTKNEQTYKETASIVQNGSDNNSQITVNFVEEGNYNNFNFTVEDKAGNKKTIGRNINFTIDKTKPTINILNRENYTTWKKKDACIEVSATASDTNGINPSSWMYKIGNGGNNTTARQDKFYIELTTDDLSNGENIIYIYVSDKAGNQAYESVSLKFDSEIPTTPVLRGITEGEKAEIEAYSNDAHSGISHYLFSKDKINWIRYDGLYEVTSNFNGNIFCKAVDNAGNESEISSCKILVDKEKPKINIQSFDSEQWYKELTVYPEITSCGESGIDENSWKYSIDGGNTWSCCSKNSEQKVYARLNTTGEYSLAFKVKSNTGIEGISETKKVKIDSYLPEININSEIPKKSKGCTVKATAFDSHSGIQIIGYELSVDGLKSFEDKENGSTITVNLSNEGKNELVFFAIDNTGNRFELPACEIIIDKTAPVILFEKIPESWVNRGELTGSSSASDLNDDTWTYHYQYQGEEEKFGEGNNFTLNRHGSPVVWFTVEDDCGNIGSSERKTVMIDTMSPIFSEPYKKEGNKISISATDADSGINKNSYKWSIDGQNYFSGNVATINEGKNINLYFSVEDICGNIITKNFMVDVVDITPPIISFSTEKYSYKESLTIDNISATDNVSGVERIYYYIDDLLIDTSNDSELSKSLNVKNFEEGSHNIWLKVVDKEGNFSKSENYSFIIDRIKPEIKNSKVLYETKEILDDDYIGKQEVEIRIQATDNTEEIKSVHYGVSFNEGVSPTNWNTQNESIITLNNNQNYLQVGRNFIYIKVEDIAGNFSEHLIKTIIKDTASPGKVIITSSTHKEASSLTDAEINTTATFVLKPSNTSSAGIKGYEYLLLKGSSVETADTVVKEGIKETTTTEILVLDNLEDNEENEFYYLKARCIGGNNIKGDYVVYCFRVDTMPPSGLYVSLNPQVNDNYFYNDEKVNISWNIPKDFTGIKEYKVELKNENSILCDPTLNNTSSVINIKNLCNEQKYGKIDVKVTAYDYANNSVSSCRSFYFDYESPEFEGGSIEINDVTENSVAKKICWGELKDSQGVDQIVIEYSRLAPNDTKINRVVINASEENILPTEYTISNLRKDSAYYLRVVGYDKAGNTAILEECFSVGKAEIPEVIKSEYKEMVNGLVITGIKEKDRQTFKETLQQGRILLPENIQIFQVNSENAKQEKITELIIEDQTEITENRIEKANITIPNGISGFITKYGIRTFNNSGFYYEKKEGLSLLNVKMEVPIDGLQNEQEVSYKEIKLGYPDSIYIKAESEKLTTPIIVKTDGFNIENVNGIKLESDLVELINFDEEGIFFEPNNIDIITSDNNKKIPLKKTYVSPSFKSVYGEVDTTGLILTLQGTKFIVNKAGINGNILNIYEAEVLLPEEFSPSVLVIKDFSINDETLEVKPGAKFETSIISVTENGIEVLENGKVTIGKDGHLFLSGSLNIGDIYGYIEVSNLKLNNNGLNLENGCNVATLTRELFGFEITIEDAIYYRNKLLIKSGKINVYENQFEIEEVGINTNLKNSVYQEGKALGNGKFDTEYTSALNIQDLIINENGIFAESMLVDVYGAETKWVFESVPLKPSMEIIIDTDKEFSTTISGYNILTKKTSFNGSEIIIQEGKIVNPQGFFKENLDISNIKLSSNSLIHGGEIKAGEEFNLRGWNVIFDKISLSQFGLNGKATVSKLEENFEVEIIYNSFTVKSDDTFISEAFDEKYSYIMKNDYYFMLQDAILKNNESDEMEIYSNKVELMAGKENTVILNNLYATLDEQVTIDTSDKNYTLRTSNGCNINVEKTTFNGEKILLEGVGSPDTFENCRSKAIELTLSPSIRVTSDYMDIDYSYNYKGWNIKGHGIQYKNSSLEIVSNVLTFNGTEIDVGDLLFSMKGDLLGENSVSQDVCVSMISNQSKITETRFSEDGLFATVYIVLPEMFSNSILAYNSVCLKPDGSYESTTVISHANISLEKISFNFDYVSLSKNGLNIGYASILIPELDNLSVELKGLSISNKGKTKLDGCVTSPFKLWNMVFSISNISFDSEKIDFSGKIRLPESMPGVLAGRTVGIRNFSIGLDGSVRELDARLEGKYTIPFLESFSLSISSVGVAYKNDAPWIMMEKASLRFPSTYCIDDVSINDIAFNPIEADFDFDTIKATTRLKTTLSGITFNLTSVSVTKEMTIGFSGNAYFGGEDLPEFIRGKSVELKQFEIKSDGNIGNIEILLDGLDGKIASNIDVVELRDGSVAVKKEEGSNSLYLGVSGALEFTDRAPAFLLDVNGKGGMALRIEDFIIDASKPCITKIDAFLSKKVNDIWTKDVKEINFDPKIGETQLNDVYVSFIYDGIHNEGRVSVSGGMILPSSLPDGIAGTEIRLNRFEIALSGEIKEFSAEYNLEKTALGSVELRDVHIGAEYIDHDVEYTIDTTLLLPKEKFVQGIGGSSTKANLVFTAHELKEVDANFRLGDIYLMNNLEVKDVNIGVQKKGLNKLQFGVEGYVVLPDSLPEGLRGTEIAIDTFVINQDGVIEDLNIGARNINVLLFNQLQLINGAVSFSKGSTSDEFLIDVGGLLEFSQNSSVPDGLKETSFAINKLQVSTKNGLVAFDAGLNEGISFEILGGVTVSVDQLFFSDSGFRVAAKAGLDFPSVDFGGVRFDASVDMLWNGKIQAFNGGLGELKVDIAGFRSTIKELYVGKFDGEDSDFMVALKECRLELPENFGSMGGKSVALKNATFNPYTGAFNGDFEVPSLVTEIAGFKLNLDAPTINFDERKIQFSKAYLGLPDFFDAAGANITVYDIIISSKDGLCIGGAGFTLPDFKMGEFGFKNVGAEFRMENGHYFISGHGGIILPNVGEIEAALTFTEITEVYPIGVKHAYFSFEAATGIPLGATGLYLSGIRGGLGYGYPEEVPEAYRNLFGQKGPRVQLGLTVKDGVGGKLARMTADAWIDIEQITWVLEGKATILEGTLNISAKAAAVIKNDCFATGMKVDLKFVRGSIELYIFDQNGTLKFSGAGEAKFGMPKSYLYDGLIVNIPPCDIWLGGFGVMFGDFTNGKRGFLGYIDIEFLGFNWGRVGAFVGTGGLSLRVSSYDICRPEGINFNQMSRYSRNASVNVLDFSSRKSANLMNAEKGSIYKVTIPGGPQVDKPSEYDLTQPVNIMARHANVVSQLTEQDLLKQEETPAKTTFVLGYLEGDPEFILYSPSGKEYRAGDKEIDTQYIENGMFISVDSPEGGDWTISVENMEEGTYELAVFGIERMPLVSIKEPSDGVLNATDTVYVSGYTSEKNKDVYIFASEDEYAPVVELGCIRSDADGFFSGYVSTDNILDGEYFISARVVTNDGMYSPAGISTGKYNVDRSNLKLEMPENVYVTECEENKIKLLWQNSNGKRTAGYKLKTLIDGQESIDDLGNITELYISNYIEGSRISYSLCSYDAYGNESNYTDYISYVIGEEKSEYNKVFIKNKIVEVTAQNGETVGCTVDVSYNNWKDENSYIQATKVNTSISYSELSDEEFLELMNKNMSYLEETNPIDVSFEKNVKIEEYGNRLKVYVTPSDICAEGEYTIECEVANDNNPKNKDTFTLKVIVENPSPVITGVYPSTIDGTKENEITIYGEGFVPGVKYYLDDNELVTVESENENLFCKTVKVPRQTRRGSHILKIINNTGEEAEYEIGVQIPSYDVSLYTSEVWVKKGDTALFNLKVTPFDGYTEDAHFFVVDCSEKLCISLPIIKMNEIGCIEVDTKNATEGVYKIMIETSSEKTFDLFVHITEEKIMPVITSFNPYKLNKGCKASVIGYGFGTIGKLFINENEILVNSYTDSVIDFVVPTDIEGNSISIYVENENGKSETIIKKVYDYDFTLRIPKDTYYMRAGETNTVNIAVNGYANNIKLYAEEEANAPIEISLSKNIVSTNAFVELYLKCKDEAVAGEYNVVVRAEGENINVVKPLKVVVLNDMNIITENLPEGILGVKYEVNLEAETQGDEVIWKINKGSLPIGLKLNSSTGILEGTPKNSGEFDFTVMISKVDGVCCERDFTLFIREEIWGMTGKNAGNTNSVVCDIPSNKQEVWTAELNEPIAKIFSNGSKVVVLTETGRMAIFSERGKRIFDSSNILYKDGFISKHYFYGITQDDILEARTLDKGFLMWSRENVKKITSNANVLLAEVDERFVKIDPVKGSLLEEITNEIKDENLVWNNDNLYGYKGEKLYSLYGETKELNVDEEILKVSADVDGFIILTENKLYNFSRDLKLICEKPMLNNMTCSLAINSNEIAVSNEDTTVLYDRETLTIKNVYLGGNLLGLANEKIVIADSAKVSINNVYSGKEIWKVEGNITAIAMCNGKLYIGDKNVLRLYDGRSNISAPKVDILYSFSEDGTNGWYQNLPIAKIEADDKETYTESIWVRFNSEDFKQYTEPFSTVEGDNLIEAYAYDSKGMKSDIISSLIKTDISKPKSNMVISSIMNERGWYRDDLYVRILATDNVSGVNKIIVNEKPYDKPLEFTEEGIYEIKWKTIDNAGNSEDEQTSVIKIDKYSPTTEINIRSDKGLSIINLKAQDSCSGIECIKYVLDNDAEQLYDKEILIFEPGYHTIKWQAFDNSGRKSKEMFESFIVQKEDGIGDFIAFAEVNDKKHEVKTPFSYESMIYANDASDYTQWPYMYWERAYLHTLPYYVIGGDFIQYLGSDMNLKGERTVEFYIKKDVTVYMFAGPEMNVDPEWILVEKNFGMQGYWYKDGWNVYKRKVSKGEKIIIEVGKKVEALPVITAKEEKER